MQKVSREVVLGHLAATYLVNCSYFGDDLWYEGRVEVGDLHNTHRDFRGFRTPENRRYVDIYPEYIAPLVSSGAIGFMPAAALPPSHVCCFRREGRCYVIDGSLRVFNAIQFGVETLPAYIHRGGECE